MKPYQRLTIIVLFILLIGISGCTGLLIPASQTLPPFQPQPLSSFTVEFIPVGTKRYPPTDVTEVTRFKNVVHYPGEPDSIRTDEKPTRPYEKIGELKFGLSWYYSSNIKELINTYVPKFGGDAVLVYHAYPGGTSAMMKDPVTGQFKDVFYQSIMVEVIRYTDK